ncbi:hypothetical protein [Bradyrhizobium australafricanum]|uniref:hypothetical protein n=1 Tax=Bradyrhizobium australafricanum TaxID=2821406 RepID=UPI001CE2DBA4|nr:hypothetical protein [Bradyrhizobium australafricanum]MCA6102783.1 hypothetical protein [Bradyrhizobium australafricanum]
MPSKLDEHMELVAKVVAKFISTGLLKHNIDSRGADQFLGEPVDNETFAAVLSWMLSEGLIHSGNVSRTINAVVFISQAQLSAKGLAIVRQPLGNGETIEKRIEKADAGDKKDWSSIGDLIGGFAGGIMKSLGSAG